MLPINDIEKKVQERTKNIKFVSHSFNHLKRTAVGARWFTKIFSGTNEQQEIAYIAGLIHDFERPLSEKIEHKDISKEEAEKFLKQFVFDEAIKEKIIKMVEEHRYVSELPLLEQCLFLSDKLLEQSGAFIIFRRCVYIGECLDFKEKPFHDSIIEHWKMRMNRFKPEKFHEKLSKLAHHQYDWQTRFFCAFENNEDWAVNIAKLCYDEGRSQAKTLVQIIEDIPAKGEGNEFKNEALLYIGGEKFPQFEKMISNS